MRFGRNVFAITVLVAAVTLRCSVPKSTQPTSPPAQDIARKMAGDAKILGTLTQEQFSSTLDRARSDSDKWQNAKDSRLRIEDLASALRPQFEKATGKTIAPLPIDYSDVAKPLYENWVLIADKDRVASFGGDAGEAIPRHETVAVSAPSGLPCSGIIIARNALATALHCANQLPELIRIGTDAGSGGTEITIDPLKFKQVKTTGGVPLDMAILVSDSPFKGIKDDDLPVFATTAMIDAAKKLKIVGFGGYLANQSGAGTKRLGIVPMAYPDCMGIDVEAHFGCLPGLEIVAGARPMLDYAECPIVKPGEKPDQNGACEGDSGGAVFVETADGKLALAALIRAIHDPLKCGCAEAANLYVRFDKQLETIRKIKGICFPPAAFSLVDGGAASPNCGAGTGNKE